MRAEAMWRTVAAGVAAVLITVTAAASANAGSPGEPAGHGSVTIQLGRSIWQATKQRGCAPLPGAVPLSRVARDLARRGLHAHGLVVSGLVGETTRTCMTTDFQLASWSDLAMLRDEFGWTFASNTSTKARLTSASPEQAWSETCGSLRPLFAHGHQQAWTTLGSGERRITPAIRDGLVFPCFGFLRGYTQDQRNDATNVPPRSTWTRSIQGGGCNVPTLPCFGPHTDRSVVYDLPSDVVSYLSAPAGEWAIGQWYRFVTGAYSGDGGVTWDCSGADPATHWTSQGELYCYDDFIWVLDHLPTGLREVTPAQMAGELGRRPRPTITAKRSATTVTMSAVLDGTIEIHARSCRDRLLARKAGYTAPAPVAVTIPADSPPGLVACGWFGGGLTSWWPVT